MIMFWTGYPQLPREVTTKLRISYLENDPTKVMAEASTCPLILALPIVHQEYHIFRDYLDKSLKYGKLGFGKY